MAGIESIFAKGVAFHRLKLARPGGINSIGRESV